MITNYYTLFHISKELNSEFAGKKISEIYTQQRNELVFSFEETESVIIAGCEPSDNFLYLRKSFARARRNSKDIFSEVVGKKIDEIFIHNYDRQIHIKLEDKKEILIQIFGSKANVILLNENKEPIGSFLKKENTAVKSNEEKNVIPTIEQLKACDENLSIAVVIKKMFPRFGSVLQQEVIIKTGLTADKILKDCTENELNRILKTAGSIHTEALSHPSFRIYFQNNHFVRLSIIPLQQYEQCDYKEYDSISEAVQTYRSQIFSEKLFLHEKDSIGQILLRESNQIERTLQKILAETPDESKSEQYEKYGKLITANIHLLKKGEKTAIVEDILANNGEVLEIPLDPHLSPAKNAERYFEKARKTKNVIAEHQERLEELSNKKEGLTNLLEHLQEVTNREMLERYVEENKNELARFGFKMQKSGHVKKEEPIPFRVFTVDGGFQVWAGKSGENNDLLSTRYTAKNDLWFHARGIGGSHVVLKIGTGKGEVSKKAIEQAAGIAAYYSKMKGSKLVPVSMCEGKYVRKPKGAPPGTVMIDREKTIFAEPGLPD